MTQPSYRTQKFSKLIRIAVLLEFLCFKKNFHSINLFCFQFMLKVCSIIHIYFKCIVLHSYLAIFRIVPKFHMNKKHVEFVKKI